MALKQVLSAITIYSIMGTVYFVVSPFLSSWANQVLSDAPLKGSQLTSEGQLLSNLNIIVQTAFGFIAIVIFLFLFIWPWYREGKTYTL